MPIELDDAVAIPTRATAGAAGFDLAAFEDVTLPARSPYVAVRTGVKLAMDAPSVTTMLAPNTLVFAEVRGRSGMAKAGVEAFNGTVDADFRGEVKVMLRNMGDEVRTIEKGDRIAQIVFYLAIVPLLAPTENIETMYASARGTSGFGSTGIK
jgi:dUTP pyrophosphatase